MNPTPGLKGTANATCLKITDQASTPCHQAQLHYLHLTFFHGMSRAASRWGSTPCPPLPSGGSLGQAWPSRAPPQPRSLCLYPPACFSWEIYSLRLLHHTYMTCYQPRPGGPTIAGRSRSAPPAGRVSGSHSFPTNTCLVSHKGVTNKPDPGPLNSDSKAPHNDLYKNDINRWLVSNTNNYITLRQRGPKWKHIVLSSAIE